MYDLAAYLLFVYQVTGSNHMEICHFAMLSYRRRQDEWAEVESL